MAARLENNQTGQNPYIGPRPFSRQEKDRFYGREREGRDLISLVISERLVLFYAQSGAGKTSLINTRLAPGLEAKGFLVLPVGRVSGELLPGVQVDNIFTTNLMLKLDMGEDNPQRFQGVTLSQFLANLVNDGKGFYYHPPSEQAAPSPASEPAAEALTATEDEYEIKPQALIIDQFEELFTTHPEAWKKRAEFLTQLASAMQEIPTLWVVLSMREDHIAELDPHASLLPGGLRTRYYMQRMSMKAAMEAVTQPVARLREFEPQAATKLVENLSLIGAGRDESGTARFVPGEFIEPVQLQVVCYQLWENLKVIPGDKITQEDLNRLSRGQDLAIFVNQALADFYQDTLQKVLRQSRVRVSEKKLRDWFANSLITEARTRGFVFMGETATEGIPNEIVRQLEGQLLRGESRAGGTWYELVHDRFIDPILQSNYKWALTQQRVPRSIAIGAGIAVIILVLILAYATNAFATQASNAQATIVINATQAEYAVQVVKTSAGNVQATNVVNATQAENVIQAVRTSRADAASLHQDQAAATATIAALQIASTAQAAQVQLFALQATGLATPTTAAGLATPTPPSSDTTPTPGTDLVATERAATSEALKSQMEDVKATQTALASPIRKLIIGQTAKGTPIWVIQLGTGTRNVVLVGGLHNGFAPATVKLAESMADYYSNHLDQIPPGIKLHIITNANPDSPRAPGNVSGRLNSNKVDLNRNWDCEWKKNALYHNVTISGGSKPFSEPETEALREYFVRAQPVGVVFWEARIAGGQASPGGCGLQSLFSESLAQIYGRAAGYDISPFEAYTVNGDATNWLDAQGIPAISVLLPEYDGDPDLDHNLKAVQTLMESYR